MNQLAIEFETKSPINRESLGRQNRMVYDLLDRHATITFLDAIKMGVGHLHSRISDLRNSNNVTIYDRMTKRGETSCKEYSLRPFVK